MTLTPPLWGQATSRGAPSGLWRQPGTGGDWKQAPLVLPGVKETLGKPAPLSLPMQLGLQQ
jgi:hypothetical protein